MTQNRVVLCMKWGTLYSAQYVNVLYKACRANLTGDFQFICLTDDAQGLNPGITAHPIPDIGCTPAHFAAGAWPKLSVFTAPLYGLSGRAVFIDLDVVIVDAIDPFFEETAPLLAVGGGPKWRHGQVPTNPTMNTSVFGFTLGQQTNIAQTFQNAPNQASASFGNEQQFVEGTAAQWRAWDAPWVVSYKRHIRRKSLLAPLLGPHPVPKGAKIVAFHGKPNPRDFADGAMGRGYDWIRDYWQRFSAP